MIDHDTAANGVSHVDVVFIIVMNGERPHLVVSHSATAACLDLIENKRDTIVQVLVFFGIGDGKKFVCLRPAVQVFLDSLFEMFRTFHRSAF